MRMRPVTLATILGVTIMATLTPFVEHPTAAAADCVSSVGPGIAPPASVPSGLHYYHASWYGQSGYPTLCYGETSTATVAFYNSGEFGWVAGQMYQMAFLGTWEPEPGQDKPSLLGGDGTNGSPNTGWPRYNRAVAQPAAYVGPAQVAWFQFTIKAPLTSGTYRVYVRPLIEGTLWMENAGVFWQVTVKGPGEEAVIVDTANIDGDLFTAGSSTFRYDANDVFQYLGGAITFAQFEQTLSRGDSIAIRYETDAARSSTFNITRDLGREAPTITGWTGEYQGGGRWNIGLTFSEPPTNQDGLAYSLQRSSLAQRPSSCGDATGPYAEIATVTFAGGSNDARYDDTNVAAGIYCYRMGTPNSVTATRFGYSAPVELVTPPASGVGP